MEELDFSVENVDEDTTVITASKIIQDRIETAIRNYDPSNIYYSTYLQTSTQQPEITKDVLDELSVVPQQDKRKVAKINQIACTYANKDWIIGKVVEVISNNVNTNFKISYNDFEDESKSKTLEEVKRVIKDFNDRINLKRLIKDAIPNCYLNGNYYFYCRRTDEGHYSITPYPFDMIEVSDFDINGEPVLLFDVKELKRRLSRTIKKTRKNKALFFDKIDKEIKQNYPKEIYDAYKAGDDYAKLDYRWSGTMRINNQNKKYGITPIFRALYSALILEQFDISDTINSKAKAKKIIAQFLDPSLTKDGRDGYAEQAYAHDNFIRAFKRSTVVVTAPAYVTDIKYIEPTVTSTESDTVKNYIERELSTLGVSFLMSTNSTGATVATISLAQLMKMINSISEQLEYIMEKFYRNLLIEAGYDAIYSPHIQIIDSELLEQEAKIELAKLLYSTFNCSLETSLEIVGIDVKDEIAKRRNENEAGYEDIFFAHQSQYTNSGSPSGVNQDGDEKTAGRPSDDNNLETQGHRDEDKARSDR